MESQHQDVPSEKSLERRKMLLEGLGIVLCTKQKDGGFATFEDQIKLSEDLNLPSVQFDFRNREDDEFEKGLELIRLYKQTHPETVVSIHGETPKINESDLSIKNTKRIDEELNFIKEIGGESYTVHPPSINSKLFDSLPPETKDSIIENYCSIFIDAIKAQSAKNDRFSVAIENMPTKGEDGSWGQKIEEIISLIKNIEARLLQESFNPTEAKSHVGATLDINHALHGANREDYEHILESWFKGLGEYLRVIHVYTPSQADDSFNDKMMLSLKFALQFNPNARLFVESKQNPASTKEIYTRVKSSEK